MNKQFNPRNRVLVVDEFPLVRAAIASILKSIAPYWEIHELSSLPKPAVEDIQGFDLLLLSIDQSGGVPHLNNLAALRQACPQLTIIVLSSVNNSNLAARAGHLGAQAFICKRFDLARITATLNELVGGRSRLAAGQAEPGETKLQALTPPLAKVLLGIQKGQTNREIAEEIGRTEATVKSHLTHIYRILGVSNRTQAAIVSRMAGSHS